MKFLYAAILSVIIKVVFSYNQANVNVILDSFIKNQIELTVKADLPGQRIAGVCITSLDTTDDIVNTVFTYNNEPGDGRNGNKIGNWYGVESTVLSNSDAIAENNNKNVFSASSLHSFKTYNPANVTFRENFGTKINLKTGEKLCIDNLFTRKTEPLNEISYRIKLDEYYGAEGLAEIKDRSVVLVGLSVTLLSADGAQKYNELRVPFMRTVASTVDASTVFTPNSIDIKAEYDGRTLFLDLEVKNDCKVLIEQIKNASVIYSTSSSGSITGYIKITDMLKIRSDKKMTADCTNSKLAKGIDSMAGKNVAGTITLVLAVGNEDFFIPVDVQLIFSYYSKVAIGVVCGIVVLAAIIVIIAWAVLTKCGKNNKAFRCKKNSKKSTDLEKEFERQKLTD